MSEICLGAEAYSVAHEPFDSPDAQRLRAAARIEVDGLHGGYPDRGGPLVAAAVAVHLVARDPQGAPLGCAALFPVEDGVFEIRRMFVRSEARGSGVAVALLRRLEAAADELDAPAIVHETSARQPRAIRFLEREGFRRIAPFGAYAGNPLSVCLAKVL